MALIFPKLKRLAAHLPGLSPRAPGVRPDPEDGTDGPDPTDRLVIPKLASSREERERASYQDQGQFMARQDRWSELSALIRAFDAQRAATAGGMPITDLLAAGARTDPLAAIMGPTRTPGSRGLADLDLVLSEHCEDHGVALVVALAHIDAGWAWRGTGWDHELPSDRRRAFDAHFARAGAILDRFDPFALDSPALAAARCALLAGQDSPAERVADDYEDLIDLDPRNPRHMRALGNHMLPRWFGSFDALELEARRTAARTGDIWGAGAYAWCYFDALAVDSGALARLDAGFFIDGLRDILARSDNQHVVNLLAAFTGLVMAPAETDAAADPAIAATRARLHDAFGWILRDHLREIHPLVWADAAMRFQPPARLPDRARLTDRGYHSALRLIARQFDSQIRAGSRILFGPDGIAIEPAG